MGTPTTFSYNRLSPSALEESELMVGKCANRIRSFPFHSIRASGTSRRWQFGRRRERRPALIQFAHSPTINSVRSIAGDLRRPL
jgi:hypothetical protein